MPGIRYKEYNDNEAEVKRLLKDLYKPSFKFEPDVIEPDPHAPFVWIAIDTKNEKVQVVYLKEKDAEGIPYKTSNWRDYL